MSFGDVIRSNDLSYTWTDNYGIGGDSAVIWMAEYDNRIAEVLVSDLSRYRTATAPSTGAIGIGGDSNTIWHCALGSDKVYELSTTDFSVVRSADTNTSTESGIGGNSTVIWYCNLIDNEIYERNVSDLSILRSSTAPSTRAVGIGGDSNTIWHCDDDDNNIYELDTDSSFTVLQTAAAPGSTPFGIGGNSDVIWHCDRGNSYVYELDTGFDKIVSGTITSRSGIPLTRATITINGNTDTTDESGQYSIAITPGTYNITAEHPLLKTISQELVVSANMTQDLTMYKVESIRKFTGMGASLEGGTSCGMGKRRR